MFIEVPVSVPVVHLAGAENVLPLKCTTGAQQSELRLPPELPEGSGRPRHLKQSMNDKQAMRKTDRKRGRQTDMHTCKHHLCPNCAMTASQEADE